MSPIAAAVLFVILVPVSGAGSALFAGWMRRARLGQAIRDYGPRLHEQKAGTPTMGGAVVLALWGIAVGAIPELRTGPGAFVLGAGLLAGAVGGIDDLIALRRGRSLGLRPYQKIVLLSLAAGALFLAFPEIGRIPFAIPFSRAEVILPSWAAFLVYWLVFLSATNGMNLTDGLDGLAAGTTVVIISGFLLIAPGAAALFPLVPILIGFLWVNFHPARLFLGDVGAFGLGGAVAGAAIVTGTSFLLPLLAGLVVLEAGSVILQVASFKLFGRRVFKISPLHHHFEHAEGIDYEFLLPDAEWPEEKIVIRLWIVAGLFAALGVIAALTGAGGGT